MLERGRSRMCLGRRSGSAIPSSFQPCISNVPLSRHWLATTSHRKRPELMARVPGVKFSILSDGVGSFRNNQRNLILYAHREILLSSPKPMRERSTSFRGATYGFDGSGSLRVAIAHGSTSVVHCETVGREGARL